MKKNKKNNDYNIKKIVMAIFVLLCIILLVLYFGKWHQVKDEEKYLNSYLVSTNTINLEMNDLEEIQAVLSETPNNYFVYVSFTKDQEIYNFEKKLEPIIKEYDLQNSFYFLNITQIKELKMDYKSVLAEKLNIKKSELKTIPVILYFENQELVNTIHTDQELKDLLENKRGY